MSEAAVDHAGPLVGVDGLVDDWTADKQTYHVPWGKAMMWIFLVSDTFIFTCFLTSYLHVRLSTTQPWPPQSEIFALSFGGDPIPLILIAIMTFILITSSGTMALAVNFGYRGDKIKGLHWRKDGWGNYHANEVTEYAESKDGYHWTEPDLNQYEIEGIPEGNVVLADEFLVTHNFSPFIDERPNAPKGERYKALGGGRYPDANWGGWPAPGRRAELRKKYGPGGLYAWASADGFHWKKLQDDAVIPERFGKFDSQNVAFWSEAEGHYVCYFRWFRNGLRSILRSTSKDFLHWGDPVDMQANEAGEHLYTSGTHPSVPGNRTQYIIKPFVYDGHVV